MEVSGSGYRTAVGKLTAVVILVIILVAAGVGIYYYSTTTSHAASTSTTTTPSTITLGPSNSSVLVDESQVSPDSLDPQYAFFSQDEGYLNAVYQSLVAFNGTNSNEVIPVQASGWTIANNSREYIFTIRPDVYFSNGDNLTAYDIWFTFTRLLYTNPTSGVATTNFNTITENLASDPFTLACGNAEPWGLINAVSAETHLAVPTNENDTAPCVPLTNFLNNMLSKFNPANSTQAAIMSYANQAYVAPNSTTFIVNLMEAYPPFISDLAGFCGCFTVDPAVVDAHANTDGLAVQNNTLNSYINAEGTVGTGPYVVKSVEGVPASEIVLVKNPHYWAADSAGTLKAGLPWLIAPAKIAEIDIKYEPPATELYDDFGTNAAQITASNPAGSAGLTQWGELWAAYQYKDYFTLSDVVRNYGGSDFAVYIGMNSQKFPTNITDFRQAVYWAMNYSELEATEIEYNGTYYGQLMLGPSMPFYGSGLYNPLNYSNPATDLTLAQQYIAKAGVEGGFYVILPNGTSVGDLSGSLLQTMNLYYEVPLSAATETQLSIEVSSLAQIGVVAAPYPITASIYDTLEASPATAPNLNNIPWGIDYPDPFLQQYFCFYTTNCGIASYVSNSTLTNLVEAAVFSTNQTFRLDVVKELYRIEAQQAYYVWLPYTDNILWVQPYVQGIYFNPYSGYWYNLMYYTPVQATAR